MFEKVFLCQGENHESECCSPREFMKTEESGKLQPKRQPRGSKKQNNIVDVCTLLNQCAQAVTSAADILRAHRLYVTASPLKKMSNFVANSTITEFAKDATSLHVIDFGISYGFQWLCLIQHISERRGGPPKIHMTAIELPQPGFRPTEGLKRQGIV
ncbi:hypothetical protein ACLB2K_031160 [Fragaria x ananassa]